MEARYYQTDSGKRSYRNPTLAAGSGQEALQAKGTATETSTENTNEFTEWYYVYRRANPREESHSRCTDVTSAYASTRMTFIGAAPVITTETASSENETSTEIRPTVLPGICYPDQIYT
jgi:hypothetical protein